MIRIGNPLPLFFDATGGLSDGGSIYIGVAGGDPQAQPVTVYWDSALTQIAEQPLRTIGGAIVNGATPSNVFAATDDYSMRLVDLNGAQAFYSASVYSDTDAFQPVSSDLSAIAMLATTPFGRSLLTLADQNALKSATGIPTPLPLSGGNMTGAIIRNGSGVHVFFDDQSLIGGGIHVRQSGGADTTLNPGDQLWTIES